MVSIGVGCDPNIAISSASVSPRKGEVARQSAMASEITAR